MKQEIGFKPILLLLAVPLFCLQIQSAHSQSDGCLAGIVIDSISGEAIAGATVRIINSTRGTATDVEGVFEFCSLDRDTIVLEVTSLGFRSLQQTVSVDRDDPVLISLRPDNHDSVEIRVVGERIHAHSIGTSSIRTDALDPGASVSDGVRRHVGFDQESFGSSATHTSIRGLSGERVSLLNNGLSVADASSTSADHTESISGFASQRVELIRGPRTLLYSSSSPHGAINVITSGGEDHGSSGVTATAKLTVPTTSLSGGITGNYWSESFRAAASVLNSSSSNEHRHEVTLEGTDRNLVNGSLRTSLHLDPIELELNGEYSNDDYGLPGGSIYGHPDPVRIKMNRTTATLVAKYRPADSWIESIQLNAQKNRYHHRELEGIDILGAEYGILTNVVQGRLNHDQLPLINSIGSLVAGWTGTDFAAEGVRIDPTLRNEYWIALEEERTIGQLTVSSAVRLDYVDLAQTKDVGAYERSYSFTTWGAGATYHVPVGPKPFVEATILKINRAPSISELYTKGPHLANLSFEIGNEELKVESGFHVEVTSGIETRFIRASLTGFHTPYDSYIFPRPNGDTNIRTRLPVYEQVGQSVVFNGFEGVVTFDLSKSVSVDVQHQLVRAKLTDTQEWLPWMPADRTVIGAEYRSDPLSLSLDASYFWRQSRTATLESPSADYLEVSGSAAYLIRSAIGEHQVSLSVENLLNLRYRSHLSRLKDRYDDPGLNISLHYTWRF